MEIIISTRRTESGKFIPHIHGFNEVAERLQLDEREFAVAEEAISHGKARFLAWCRDLGTLEYKNLEGRSDSTYTKEDRMYGTLTIINAGSMNYYVFMSLLALPLAVYFLLGLVLWDWNISTWAMFPRLVLVAFGLLGIFFAWKSSLHNKIKIVEQ